MKRCWVIIMLLSVSCGHSQLITQAPPDSLNVKPGTITSSFSLGSDFPTDIDIPNIARMRGTAFITSTANPAGVLAVDIDTRPLALSSNFKGVVSPTGSGIPNNLLISNTDEAYLLTSTSVIAFNPQSGNVIATTSIFDPVSLNGGHLNSAGQAPPSLFTPNFPGHIARVEDRLYISTSNYVQTKRPAITNPGTILVYNINSDKTLSRNHVIITSCFNPTGLSVRNGTELVVTNSGVIDIESASGIATSDACIDFIDLETDTIIDTLSLGRVAAAFHPIAISRDGTVGFLGSAATGNLFQIDLVNHAVLKGGSDPIQLTLGSDFITDAKFSVDSTTLFAASFEMSSVFAIDLTEGMAIVQSDPFVVGYAAGASSQNPSGANTGAGPIALRPGSKGVDYEGEDLFVLTSYPGRLVAINTGNSAVAPEEIFIAPNENRDPPPAPPTGNAGDSCQGFIQSVVAFQPGDTDGYPPFGLNSVPGREYDIILGPPYGDENTRQASTDFDVLSLGAFGEITIDMGNCHVVDRPGFDFTVFENPFCILGNCQNPAKELAEVSVSLDGINFFSFNCDQSGYPYDGCAGVLPVLSHPDNGISPWNPSASGGDAFDLAILGVTEARYIRLRDLDGVIVQGGENASGFDLDAIAVINGEIH